VGHLGSVKERPFPWGITMTDERLKFLSWRAAMIIVSFAIGACEKQVDKPVTPPLNAQLRLPGVSIENIWEESNITVNGQPGLRIHARFRTNNLQNVECHIAAYFLFDNGEQIKDYNGAYKTTDNFVAVGKDFTPGLSPSVYPDVDLFIPYDELNLQAGNYRLRYLLRIFDKDLRRVSQFSEPREFSYDVQSANWELNRPTEQ